MHTFDIYMYSLYVFRCLPVFTACSGTVASVLRFVTDNEIASLVNDDKDSNLWIEVVVQRNGRIVMRKNGHI
jgi:hypothetical protein